MVIFELGELFEDKRQIFGGCVDKGLDSLDIIVILNLLKLDKPFFAQFVLLFDLNRLFFALRVSLHHMALGFLEQGFDLLQCDCF